MIETIIDLDKQLLLLLNGMHNPFWDQFMWLFSGKMTWAPLVLAFIYTFFTKNWQEALLVILMLVLTITLCDQISSSFFKPFFARFRPTHDPVISHLVHIVNEYRGGRFGFISSHAMNAAGFVTFTVLLFRYRFYTISAVLWALINSYSRIYLGVHYVGDVLVGLLLGVIIGALVYWFYLYLRKKLSSYFEEFHSAIPYGKAETRIPLLFIYASYLVIVLFSFYKII